MGRITRLETAAEYAVRLREEAAADQRRKKAAKKEDVMRLVEAQITGCVDLSPEEMVDAAFLIVERIEGKIYGEDQGGK
jgi:hypothetical protein